MKLEDKRTLREVVTHLSAYPFVNAIILFGSAARGTTNSLSDIDIAVVTSHSTGDQEFKIIGQASERFDIHVFSHLPLNIQFRVLKEGKILFVRDEELLQTTQTQIIREYLDFAPCLHQFCEKVILNG